MRTSFYRTVWQCDRPSGLMRPGIPYSSSARPTRQADIEQMLYLRRKFPWMIPQFRVKITFKDPVD